MTEPRLILAVTTYGRGRFEAPLVAGAVLLASADEEPIIRYVDGSHRQREEALFRDPRRIPEALVGALRQYVRRSALGWAAIVSRDACQHCSGLFTAHRDGQCPVGSAHFSVAPEARLRLMGRAVHRALERWIHIKEPARTFNPRDLLIHIDSAVRLPTDLVPPVIPQAAATAGDWRSGEAAFLARDVFTQHIIPRREARAARRSR